ncbi:glycine betaine/L-proline transport ATP binding subunit, partial [Striga asiatica]
MLGLEWSSLQDKAKSLKGWWEEVFSNSIFIKLQQRITLSVLWRAKNNRVFNNESFKELDVVAGARRDWVEQQNIIPFRRRWIKKTAGIEMENQEESIALAARWALSVTEAKRMAMQSTRRTSSDESKLSMQFCALFAT